MLIIMSQSVLGHWVWPRFFWSGSSQWCTPITTASSRATRSSSTPRSSSGRCPSSATPSSTASSAPTRTQKSWKVLQNFGSIFCSDSNPRLLLPLFHTSHLLLVLPGFSMLTLFLPSLYTVIKPEFTGQHKLWEAACTMWGKEEEKPFHCDRDLNPSLQSWAHYPLGHCTLPEKFVKLYSTWRHRTFSLITCILLEGLSHELDPILLKKIPA